MSSPYRDQRPADCPPTLIVVHGISLPPGRYGVGLVGRLFTGTLSPQEPGVDAQTAALRVSAHLLIDRTGQVTQFVPFQMRAWHAGESRYGTRTRCNDFSIGIELEGSDTDRYEPVQYSALAGVIEALLRAYPSLSRDRIVGHSDIAPGRKTDPGPLFDWGRLAGELRNRLDNLSA